MLRGGIGPASCRKRSPASRRIGKTARSAAGVRSAGGLAQWACMPIPGLGSTTEKRARAPFFLVIFFRSVVVLVNRIEKRRAPPASARQLLLLLLLSTAPTKSERAGDNGRAAVTFPYQHTTPEFVRRRKSRGRPLRPRAS